MNKLKRLIIDVYMFLKTFVFKSYQIPEYTLDPSISNKQKFFLIGMNKTGTTSVKDALIDHGIKVGKQGIPSLMYVYQISRGDYSGIINYCHTAQCFKDVPFSVPNVYKEIYKKFPDAKYVLTIRDSDQQWYDSLYNFYIKKYAKNKKITRKDLFFCRDYHIGFTYLRHKQFYGKRDFMNETVYKNIYNSHNKDVETFFRDKQHQFLKINVSDEDSFKLLFDFLNIESNKKSFPWTNKTQNI